MIAAAVALCACASEHPDECFQPGPDEATDCLIVDGEQTLSFLPDAPPAQLADLCAARCVDADKTYVLIQGFDDLRKVPALPKFRRAHGLFVDTSKLADLRGLERVDIDALDLAGDTDTEAPAFKSLSGFSDTGLQSLTISHARELRLLAFQNAVQTDSLRLVRVGVEELSAVDFHATDILVDRAPRLRTMALGASPMSTLEVVDAPQLTSLTWPSGLTVSHSITIAYNPQLSSCEVARFVSETSTAGRTFVDTTNNGPCP